MSDDTPTSRQEKVQERLERLSDPDTVWVERIGERPYAEIDGLSRALDLTDGEAELGYSLYETVSEEGLLRGRSIDSVAAAVVYIVSRQSGNVRTLDEVTAATNVPRKEIGKIYRDIIQTLDIPLSPVSPAEHVRRFVEGACEEYAVDCDALGTKAIGVIEECDDRGMVSGRSPSGYAAAAIYGVAKGMDAGITQVDLAKEFDVSEVTIRKSYRDQVRVGIEVGILNPEDYLSL